MKIQALDLSVDLLRVLLWQYNDAARLQSLLQSKQGWYNSKHTGFWSDWTRDVFDLTTANDFGLAVWAVLLNVPLVVTGGADAAGKPIFGFDVYRDNFAGANFTSGSSAALTTEQKRLLLRLRYFQLVTRGAVPEVNEFLREVFGNIGGAPLAPGLYPALAVADVETSARPGSATYIAANGRVTRAQPDAPRVTYDPTPLAPGLYPALKAADLAGTWRASTATYIGPDGLLKTAAADVARFTPSGLLAEGRATNLVPDSQNMAAASWSKSRTTVALAATPAPDGTLTAWRLVEDTTAANTHSMTNAAVPVKGGTVYRWSVFAKYDGTRRYLRLRAGDNVGFLADTIVDLITGAWAAGGVTLSVDTLADGWFRVSIPATTNAAATLGSISTWLYDTANGGGTYTGDGTSGVLVWGFQLEENAATSYIPTSGAAATREPDGVVPVRAPLGLLVEPAATNLYKKSQDFTDAGWSKPGATVTAAPTVRAPDGTFTAQFLAENAANSTHRTYQFTPVTAGVRYVGSVHVKPWTRSVVYFNWGDSLFGSGSHVAFDLATGTVIDGLGRPERATLQALPDGWFRLSWAVDCIASSAATGLEILLAQTSAGGAFANTTYTGDGASGLYLWGAQLEVDALSTYIPTDTISMSRGADVIRLHDPDADTPGKVYVVDSGSMAASYIFPQGVLTSAVELVLTEYDILPRPAGVNTQLVIRGDADGFGFGRYHENFANGPFNI